MALILLPLLTSSCSSLKSQVPAIEVRKIANDIYKCKIKENNLEYIFMPHLKKLEIKEGVLILETIFLQENDLLPEGYSYVPDNKSRNYAELKKMDFYSFAKFPSLTIEFKKRIGLRLNIISAPCTIKG